MLTLWLCAVKVMPPFRYSLFHETVELLHREMPLDFRFQTAPDHNSVDCQWLWVMMQASTMLMKWNSSWFITGAVSWPERYQ